MKRCVQIERPFGAYIRLHLFGVDVVLLPWRVFWTHRQGWPWWDVSGGTVVLRPGPVVISWRMK